MEEKTIFSITLNNKNEIRSNMDLSSILGEEDALRFIHSLLDEFKQDVLRKIREIKAPVKEDDEFDF